MKLPKIKCNLFCASAVLFMLAGLWQAFSPLLLHHTAMTETMQSVKNVRPDEIGAVLAQSMGKPALVYAYATWCDKCALTTPLVVRAIRGNQLKDVTLIAVAMDKERYELAHYLVTKNYQGLWTPYMSEKPLGDTLKLFGGSYVPGVPYVALFDGVGVLAEEKLGIFTEQDLERILTKLPGNALPSSSAPAP